MQHLDHIESGPSFVGEGLPNQFLFLANVRQGNASNRCDSGSSATRAPGDTHLNNSGSHLQNWWLHSHPRITPIVRQPPTKQLKNHGAQSETHALKYNIKLQWPRKEQMSHYLNKDHELMIRQSEVFLSSTQWLKDFSRPRRARVTCMHREYHMRSPPL